MIDFLTYIPRTEHLSYSGRLSKIIDEKQESAGRGFGDHADIKCYGSHSNSTNGL